MNKHRPTTPYQVTVSRQQAEAAQSSISRLCRSLGEAPLSAPRMKMPVIAYSSTEIVWGDLGEVDTKNKFEIVIDIASISDHELTSLSPRQLQAFLFNERVSKRVNEALLWAMVWTKDVESKGHTPVNGEQLGTYMGQMFACFQESVALFLNSRGRG